MNRFKLFIDEFGIHEYINSYNARFQTTNSLLGYNVYHNTEFDISLNYNDLLLFKLLNYYNNICNNIGTYKIRKIDIYCNDVAYVLHNVVINNIEHRTDSIINFTLIPDYFEKTDGEELRLIQVALRKDKIKKIMNRIKV